jgi:hypothetical protein
MPVEDAYFLGDNEHNKVRLSVAKYFVIYQAGSIQILVAYLHCGPPGLAQSPDPLSTLYRPADCAQESNEELECRGPLRQPGWGFMERPLLCSCAASRLVLLWSGISPFAAPGGAFVMPKKFQHLVLVRAHAPPKENRGGHGVLPASAACTYPEVERHHLVGCDMEHGGARSTHDPRPSPGLGRTGGGGGAPN